MGRRPGGQPVRALGARPRGARATLRAGGVSRTVPPRGCATFEITGDVDESGDLPFAWIEGGLSGFVEGGWVAYFHSKSDADTTIQINSNPSTLILNYGDGKSLVIGTVEAGCTFDFSQNDPSGLVGSVDCPTTIASDGDSGALLTVALHADVDVHT